MSILRTVFLCSAIALTHSVVRSAGDSPPALMSKNGGKSVPTLAELKKAAAKGDRSACYQLGELYRAGTDVPKDLDQAVALIEQAARAGEPNAMFRMGMMLDTGEGVPLDNTRALGYFRAAAVAGVPEAMHNLGAAYARGKIIRRDYSEALAWIILAEKKGATSDAQDRIRTHIQALGHPEWIAAGEKRAVELEKEISQKSPVSYLPPPADAPTKKSP